MKRAQDTSTQKGEMENDDEGQEAEGVVRGVIAEAELTR